MYIEVLEEISFLLTLYISNGKVGVNKRKVLSSNRRTVVFFKSKCSLLLMNTSLQVTASSQLELLKHYS